MAELTPIPSTQRPAESGYQPVAGYAVAAMLTAGAFAVFTLILIYVGIRQQRTPLSYEVLVLAAGGIVLSIIGRSQIKSSEGTRTGLRLTSLAWWICVLGGVGFAAFLSANEYFLRRESRIASDAFFELLRNGRLHEAFLKHMMPPEQRGRAQPDAPDFEQIYALGGYVSFANNDVVRVFQRNGAAVKVQHLGSRDVGQENNGFKCTNSYRITSPEGEFDVDIKLVAVEPKRAGEKLQWYTPGGAAGIGQPKGGFVTKYGVLRHELDAEGERFGKQWMAAMVNHWRSPAHLMTLAKADRERGELAVQRAMVLGGCLPILTDLPKDFLPGDRAQRNKVGVDDLIDSGFFRSDDDGSPVPADKLDALRKYFSIGQIVPSSPTRGTPMAADTGNERPIFLRTETSITVAIPVELQLATPREFAPATIGVVCANPGVVAALNDAFAKGTSEKYDVSANDGAAVLQSVPPRDWRIAWFKTKMETVTPLVNGNAPPGRVPPGATGGVPRQ